MSAPLHSEEPKATMPDHQQQYNPNYPQGGQAQPAKMDNHMVLYIIAFFIPALAVFMHTGECGRDTLITLLLSFLFYVPGLIYAIFIIHKDQQRGVQPKMMLMQPAQPQGVPVNHTV